MKMAVSLSLLQSGYNILAKYLFLCSFVQEYRNCLPLHGAHRFGELIDCMFIFSKKHLFMLHNDILNFFLVFSGLTTPIPRICSK